jgi:hypothetical protein
MKHLTEEDLILHCYGEAEHRTVVEEHLSRCSLCLEEFQHLQAVLVTVEAFPVAERPENYGAEVWRRLQPRLQPQRATLRRPSRWDSLLGAPRWAMAAATVLLVIAAFLVGRFLPRPDREVREAISEQARTRILLVNVADHLDGLQRVLSELINTEGNGATDISSEQKWARDLVAANRIYRQTAARSGELAVAGVLDELEPVLLEIVHAPSKLSTAELDEIRQRIDSQGLLFKIRVAGSRARQRETASMSEQARRTL